MMVQECTPILSFPLITLFDIQYFVSLVLYLQFAQLQANVIIRGLD